MWTILKKKIMRPPAGGRRQSRRVDRMSDVREAIPDPIFWPLNRPITRVYGRPADRSMSRESWVTTHFAKCEFSGRFRWQNCRSVEWVTTHESWVMSHDSFREMRIFGKFQMAKLPILRMSRDSWVVSHMSRDSFHEMWIPGKTQMAKQPIPQKRRDPRAKAPEKIWGGNRSIIYLKKYTIFYSIFLF